jgi:hypothetical protein
MPSSENFKTCTLLEDTRCFLNGCRLKFGDELLTGYVRLTNEYTCQLYTWNGVHREELTITHLDLKFPAFYTIQCSLPCSQQPTSGPYPGPSKQDPHFRT